MEHGWPLNNLGSIWYHSELAGVPCSKNVLRPISWFGLFLQINDSSYLIVYVRTTGDPLSVTSRLKSLKISATKFEPQWVHFSYFDRSINLQISNFWWWAKRKSNQIFLLWLSINSQKDSTEKKKQLCNSFKSKKGIFESRQSWTKSIFEHKHELLLSLQENTWIVKSDKVFKLGEHIFL